MNIGKCWFGAKTHTFYFFEPKASSVIYFLSFASLSYMYMCLSSLFVSSSQETENRRTLDEAYLSLKFASQSNPSPNIVEYYTAALLPGDLVFPKRASPFVQIFMEQMPGEWCSVIDHQRQYHHQYMHNTPSYYMKLSALYTGYQYFVSYKFTSWFKRYIGWLVVPLGDNTDSSYSQTFPPSQCVCKAGCSRLAPFPSSTFTTMLVSCLML